MKHLFLILFLVSPIVFAESLEAPNNDGVIMTSKPTPCKNTKELAEEILDKYGEEPVWSGNDDESDSKYTITYNKKTKTFTIIQYNDDLACVLGYGNNTKREKI